MAEIEQLSVLLGGGNGTITGQSGTAAINGAGSSGANSIVGNAGRNYIEGHGSREDITVGGGDVLDTVLFHNGGPSTSKIRDVVRGFVASGDDAFSSPHPERRASSRLRSCRSPPER
jgi:hypothetical protein